MRRVIIIACSLLLCFASLPAQEEEYYRPPNISDDLINSRFEQFTAALATRNIALAYTFFDPGHMIENILMSDLDPYNINEAALDTAICDWGFMTVSGPVLRSIKDISRVTGFRIEPDWDGDDTLIITVRLKTGQTGEYSTYINSETWLLYGASG